jgi:two-component system chemotaxis response regulator CheB
VLPVAKIGALLGELAGQGAAPAVHNSVDPDVTAENEIAALGPMTTDEIQSARPSGFSCPSCHGVLFELNGDPAPRYRCHVGHAWSPGSLMGEQSVDVEETLWIALRALEEHAAMHLRLAEAAEQRERHRAAALYREHYEKGKAEAMRLRELIGRVSSGTDKPQDDLE